MERLTKCFIFGLFLVLGCLAPLRAQTARTLSNSSNQAAEAQASAEMTRKITDLVDAGKYAEAQALTTGLLVAYPDYHFYQYEGAVENGPAYPSEWQPVISFSSQDANTIGIVIPSQIPDPKSNRPLKYPVTLTFTKVSEAQ